MMTHDVIDVKTHDNLMYVVGGKTNSYIKVILRSLENLKVIIVIDL